MTAKQPPDLSADSMLFRLPIGLFLSFASGTVLCILFWLAREGLEAIDTIAQLSSDIEQRSLPELLQNQRTLVHIESLRRNAEVVYISEDVRLRRAARINAQAMAAESIFERDPNFYAAVQHASGMITALAKLKDEIQTTRSELFSQTLAALDRLQGVQLMAGVAKDPALDALYQTREFFSDAKIGAAPPLSGERLAETDALCRRMAGGNAEQLAHCKLVKSMFGQYAARHKRYQEQCAESEAKWREVDAAIRELRDTVSTSSEAASVQSLTAIKNSALEAHDQAGYVFGGAILALGLYLLLLHKIIVQPIKWTAKKLSEIQQGDLHVEMPVIRIEELAEVAELLDRFSTHLSELYTHTSRLEEDSAGKRDLEEIMRAVFQVAPDGFIIWNETGPLSISPGCMALLGISSMEEARVHSAKLGLPFHTADASQREVFQQAVAKGISRLELVYSTLDGRPMPCEVTRMRIDLRGKPVMLSYLRDMRNQKQAEETLRQAKEQAEVATKAKSEFLARMSHEIRTPMNGVLGLTHMAMSHNPPPEQQKFLSKIQASAKILLGVLNDILDFSKIESGKMQLEKSPFALDEMLTTLTDLFQPQAEDKNLSFTIECGPDVPHGLLGDSLRLSQVLLNLCGNAIKFTEKGGICLRISLAREQAPPVAESRTGLHFSVADTGVGMDSEQLARLFKPFVQADVSTTRKYGGTGLGLAISRLLVEMMGGTLEVESSPGQGSRFSFTLDFALPAPGELEAYPCQQEMETAGLLGRRVLLVEDNEINREIAVALLEELGVRALVAVNGREALAVLEKEDVDGVLMDIQMPVMDGLTAVKILRREGRPAVRTLPVIAMTAHAMQEDRDKSLSAGMDDHITKPIDIAELACALVRWIGGGGSAAGK